MVDRPPSPKLPKCGAPRRGEQACAQLRAGRAPDGGVREDARRVGARDVAAAWERALEPWDDSAAHDALLQLVAEHGAYAWAAAQYREAKRGAGARASD